MRSRSSHEVPSELLGPGSTPAGVVEREEALRTGADAPATTAVDTAASPDAGLGGDSDAFHSYLREMGHFRLMTHDQTIAQTKAMADAKAHMVTELGRLPGAARHALRLCRESVEKGNPLSQLLDSTPANSTLNEGGAERHHGAPVARDREQWLHRIEMLESRYRQWERRKDARSHQALSGAFADLAPNIHLLRAVGSVCREFAIKLAPERAVGAAQVLSALEAAAGTDRETLEEVCRRVGRADTQYSGAWKEMVQANLRLVIAVARRFAAASVPLEDLVQEGNVGLFRAVEKFDHRLGYRFSTYASFWIRQAVTKALINHGRTMRVPAHMNDKIVKLFNARSELQRALGRQATPSELAAQSGLPVETVRLALESAQSTLSLDSPMGDDDGGTLHDATADMAVQPLEDTSYAAELHDVIGALLERLPQREALILRLRHGIDGTDPMTLDQIATVIGVSRERVRQLEARAMVTVRGYIEADVAELAASGQVSQAR